MTQVRIEAPARLHLGMFDLGGSLGRRFGGIGVAVTQPQIALEASRAQRLTAEGPGAERALAFARAYLHAADIDGGATIRIERAIPSHVGLGSGTKLGLAVAQALAVLYEQSTDPATLARLVGRGQRSAIGLWTFANGGLVVEGGQRVEQEGPAPLLCRYAMPATWRCVLVTPADHTGLSGGDEARAFQQLRPPAELAARICHLVLMALLPALVEQNLAEFGAALTTIQRLVGDSFGPAQGGQFANSRSAQLIEAMLDWGAAGAGQSSWGPTVYGVVADEQQGLRLAEQARALLAGQGTVELVAFDNQGARLQRDDQ